MTPPLSTVIFLIEDGRERAENEERPRERKDTCSTAGAFMTLLPCIWKLGTKTQVRLYGNMRPQGGKPQPDPYWLAVILKYTAFVSSFA